jgi:hypothetical protein
MATSLLSSRCDLDDRQELSLKFSFSCVAFSFRNYYRMCVGDHAEGNSLVCFLYWQVMTSCILSIVGSCFVFITFFLLPKTRTPLLELVVSFRIYYI